MSKKPTHFEGLTALRGIAALTVVFSHIDQFHYLFGFDSYQLNQTEIAEDAVTLFFVLSGFLITYLLLEEKSRTKTINVKYFYMRRVLRIWPVYFISLIAASILVYLQVIESTFNLGLSILLFVFMLPNLARALGLSLKAITPLWSVGVEEQFYLIWPWIVKKNRSIFIPLILVVLAYLAFKVCFWYLEKEGGEYALIKMCRIDCMAFGGILAFYFIEKKYMALLNHKLTQWFSLAIVLGFPILGLFLPFSLEIEIKALAYGILILNIATNPKALFRPSGLLLNFLGKISYGIYCYHMILIYTLAFLAKKSWILVPEYSYFAMAAIILTGTCLVAYASYQWIEKPFLKLKRNFGSMSKS